MTLKVHKNIKDEIALVCLPLLDAESDAKVLSLKIFI